MNITEAAKLLNKGYKIRLNDWNEGQYIYNEVKVERSEYKYEGGRVFENILDQDEKQYCLYLSDLLNDQWEQYNPFKEAIDILNSKLIDKIADVMAAHSLNGVDKNLIDIFVSDLNKLKKILEDKNE